MNKTSTKEKYAIIGIDEFDNKRRICVENSKEDAQKFIDSQRVEHTYICWNGYKSNFSHNHILRGYVDAEIELYDESKGFI
jgi:hypothetical protein